MEREVDEAVWKSQGRECTKNEEENHIEKPENRKLGKNEDCCEGLMKNT